MIHLNPEHLQTIYSHAETTYPEECCGLLLGSLTDSNKIALEVIPTENAWSETSDPFEDSTATKQRRYTIAPQVMLQVQKDARDRNLSIIGIYHSHINNPANPSEFDRQLAWQEYSYLIVSVMDGKVAGIKSWILDDNHQFQAEAMDVGSYKKE
ncbi:MULTISPECIES: M67 family metallopeptidase [Nostocales]|uniref:M67 family metallopeptidase n=3 Tax=Nostocales TaxID=1161 RepID=A0A0C1QTB9_9CYAN|nr:M67 family metallopeptidase [Tolypothrix bouteillei]KAF3889481.1 M67 family metallopeptidase [Tolypothrix bouteillei VB521301]